MKKDFFDGKKKVLSNGINLITVKRDTKLTAINIGIQVGSLNEEKKEKGISHFIEHMLFKGTEHRDNESLNNNIEDLGGDCNAYTDYTSTVYSLVALSDEIDKALEILSDMTMNSNFPKEEVEKERGVILAELRASRDDIDDLSFRKVNEAAFNKSSLRNEVLGEEKTIKGFKRDDLINYFKKYYVPNNCFISIVSPYEHEEVALLVEKHFSSWKEKKVNFNPIIIENNCSVIKNSYKVDIEQSTIVYLYTFYNLTREEELALRILNHRLGESSNSILFRELREKRGLAYDIYTHLDASKNVKTIYIYTSVDEEKIEETMKIINSSIEYVKEKKVIFDENTLSLMKKIFKTSLFSTLEDSSELSHYVLVQAMEDEEMYGFIDEMESIDNMESGHIYNIATKVLKEPTIHILRPEKSE